MSSETPTPWDLPPETYMNPEFWDGHSLSDTCKWEPVPPAINRSPLRLIQEIRAESKTAGVAGKILRGYLELPDHTPIRAFRDGEVFDANLYPEGTIVRFTNDKLYFDMYGDKKPHFLDSVRWGVSIRPDEQMDLIIVSWSQGLMHGTKPGPWSLKISPILKTKDVVHSRMQAGRGFRQSESISRINLVDLMGQGIGIKKEAKEETRGWIGKTVTSS